MKKTVLIAAASAAVAAFGELAEMKQGDFTVRFTDCPKCPMRARFAPDGKSASVNVARVAEKDRAAMAKRAFALMAMAEDAKKPSMARPLDAPKSKPRKLSVSIVNASFLNGSTKRRFY